MKKFKYLLILLMFVPILHVKADELICNYKDGNKTAYIKMEGSSGSWKIIGGEVTAYGSTNTIGYIAVGSRTVKLADYNETFAYCFNQMGLTHPPSAGVGILKPHDCSGTLEYGCFNFVNPPSTPEEETPIKPSDKYDGITKCDDGRYTFIPSCGCMPAALTDLTSRLYGLLKIVAPVLLIIVGGFDLIKAITAADEKSIQKEQTKLIKKFVAAFIIFLLFTIVQMLIGLISNDAEGTIKCLDYIINGYNP